VTDDGFITGASFVMGSSMVLLLYAALSGRRSRLESRLETLSAQEASPNLSPVRQMALRTLPRMGQALVPKDNEERTKLQTRLIHAGCYSREAILLFFGVKVLLMVAPAALGVLLILGGFLPATEGLLGMICFCVAGMLGPSFWLDHRKRQRQTSFRRALPDALDVIVICLEGGLSLHGALRRVGSELRTAHPVLARELSIVQREIHLGQSPGEALQHFADRGDLPELRSLAGVISQSERFGASLVKALRTHADTLRSNRLLHAEELAQKAAVKILVPTILCIFPGLFLVILGPAAIQMVATLGELHK
jgi:tight adherence protein C